ncbi:transposase [Paracraurococcus lichenis]|uniref:Transposase n=1 Tax=Paracraurococcus lichenis TaxID=3064888 RepID=A0ABT9EDS3_9PROT|nr:transposase [Paracraurococcus sp. LOR1-02]MDO9714361.1 transposase [Paracraurococcus sp. LOR1-02]
MALGRQKGRQSDLLVTWAEMPRSPGHAFYDRLQAELLSAGFDGFVEGQCAPYYAARQGRPSLPPGRYFRMLLVGYFEGIDSERGLEWRCADSLSLREFLRLGEREAVPDHSWLSRTRARLPLEVHDAVFTWVLQRLAEHGLIKGERIGVDASTMEANAALRAIVRRDGGESYREMLVRMAKESGIETPTTEDLIRLDRKRKGKTLSNAEWESPTDPDARIAKLKDGRTHLAYKPEHALDLDTGAVVAAEMHSADRGDTATLPDTLARATRHLAAVEAAPSAEAPAEMVADKGYHSRGVLKTLDDGPWKSRIAEPKRDGFSRWHGDDAARRAVVNNRTRLLSGVAHVAFKLRAEVVERSFALILDRGGMRRAWLRGRENLHKRYLIHVAGYNLGLIMRLLTGVGTPRGFQARISASLIAITTPDAGLVVILIVVADDQTAAVAISIAPDPFG